MTSLLQQSKAIVRSLLQDSLFLEHINGVKVLDRHFFEEPMLSTPLNFSQKLGLLYEDALELLLVQSPEVEELHRGLQVFRSIPTGGRETLGEFDFVFKLRGRWVHLELAIKFYLSVKRGNEVFWPGPDARDNWNRKRVRLVEHQLQLGEREEGKKVLSQVTGSENIEKKVLIYGCLFDKKGSKREKAKGVSPRCNRGIWITADNFREEFRNKRLTRIPKHLWPVSDCLLLVDLLGYSLHEELMLEVESRCTMITDGEQRIFVVSDRWLDEVGLI